VDVLDVRGKIRLVTDAVFPETSLPDATFPALPPALAFCFALRELTREATFDDVPARSIILIAVRKSPDAVKMLRQTTIASIENGSTRFASANPTRSAAIWVVRSWTSRFEIATVKKKAPPRPANRR